MILVLIPEQIWIILNSNDWSDGGEDVRMLICCDVAEEEEQQDDGNDEEDDDDPHLRQTVRLWLEWGSSLRAEAKIGGERGLTAVLYVSTFPGITWES